MWSTLQPLRQADAIFSAKVCVDQRVSGHQVPEGKRKIDTNRHLEPDKYIVALEKSILSSLLFLICFNHYSNYCELSHLLFYPVCVAYDFKLPLCLLMNCLFHLIKLRSCGPCECSRKHFRSSVVFCCFFFTPPTHLREKTTRLNDKINTEGFLQQGHWEERLPGVAAPCRGEL